MLIVSAHVPMQVLFHLIHIMWLYWSIYTDLVVRNAIYLECTYLLRLCKVIMHKWIRWDGGSLVRCRLEIQCYLCGLWSGDRSSTMMLIKHIIIKFVESQDSLIHDIILSNPISIPYIFTILHTCIISKHKKYEVHSPTNAHKMMAWSLEMLQIVDFKSV